MDTEAGEEDDDLFGAFQFRSFKTQKLIEEDYEFINIKDPEKPQDLIVKEYLPEDKMVRDAVELVPVESQDLANEEKKKQKARQELMRSERKVISEDRRFISKKDSVTQRALVRRQKEIKNLIEKK